MAINPAAVYAIPVGVTTSFTGLQPNINSPTFTVGNGHFVVTFNPADTENVGVLSLTDGNGIVVVSMVQPGYAALDTAGGAGFYFTATNGTATVALTQPSIWR